MGRDREERRKGSRNEMMIISDEGDDNGGAEAKMSPTNVATSLASQNIFEGSKHGSANHHETPLLARYQNSQKH